MHKDMHNEFVWPIAHKVLCELLMLLATAESSIPLNLTRRPIAINEEQLVSVF